MQYACGSHACGSHDSHRRISGPQRRLGRLCGGGGVRNLGAYRVHLARQIVTPAGATGRALFYAVAALGAVAHEPQTTADGADQASTSAGATGVPVAGFGGGVALPTGVQRQPGGRAGALAVRAQHATVAGLATSQARPPPAGPQTLPSRQGAVRGRRVHGRGLRPFPRQMGP